MQEKFTNRTLTVFLHALGGFMFALLPIPGLAQRINFSTWTPNSEITITPLAATALNFNQKKPVLIAGSEQVSISLTDTQTVAYRIEAPEGYDLTVEVIAPDVLTLGGTGSTKVDERIPFTLSMAYNNLQAGDEPSAKSGAVQVPAGFYNMTFPVTRRTLGAPGPPPTPESGENFVRTKATAWLFFYGNLGPIGNVIAGQYAGDITINVYLSTY